MSEIPAAWVMQQQSSAHLSGVGAMVQAPPSSRVAPVEPEAQPNVIDICGLPPSAAGLLKQLLASMADKEGPKVEKQAMVVDAKINENESSVLPEKSHELGESSAQGEARNLKVINKPYCHRCLSKGHVKEDCTTPLACDICTSLSHLKQMCPLQKKASKVFAMTCGYAVDGLGFYYIPHQALTKPKGDQNAAIIWVIEGLLSGDQVVAEMDHLVPGNTKWVVQEVDRNTFRANFQSKAELNRMVVWGMVQTKDRMAKMIIEEGNGGSHYKQALRKVWVQMSGLPGEFQEYLTTWAISTIIGVTKDVDIITPCVTETLIRVINK
jgi:hypothetical protein